MSNQEQRQAVIDEAKTWIGTHYHHQGRVKGAGVDCAMLLIEVYSTVGLIPNIDTPKYSPDWFLHQSGEEFLEWVKLYAYEVPESLPGDIVVYRVGKCFAHGGIVLDWPMIIHAYHGSRMVEYALGDQGPFTSRVAAGGFRVPRERVFYRLNQWSEE